jgi:hypothetical protein
MKEEIQKERRCNVNMMKEKEGLEKSWVLKREEHGIARLHLRIQSLHPLSLLRERRREVGQHF